MSIRYSVRIKDPILRKADIALRVRESTDKRQTRREYKFRGGVEKLAVIYMPINDLVYRLENYRTKDRQLSLMASGKRPTGFFDATRREDPSVQQAQHEILVEQSKRGSGESIKPIFDELDRVAEQTEDLLISADGVVVNGNRRLSAMRELYSLGGKFKGFEQILCAVLPESASPDEIRKLEIGLQMQPETKQWQHLRRNPYGMR